MQHLKNLKESTTDLQVWNTLFIPLGLCYICHSITQQPYCSFSLDSEKNPKTVKQNNPSRFIPLGATSVFLHFIFSLNKFGGKERFRFMPNPSTETVQIFLVVTCQWFSWRLREFSTADEGFLQQFTDQIFTNHNVAVKRSWVWCFLCDSISSCRIKPFLPPFNPPPLFSQHVCWKRKWSHTRLGVLQNSWWQDALNWFFPPIPSCSA